MDTIHKKNVPNRWWTYLQLNPSLINYFIGEHMRDNDSCEILLLINYSVYMYQKT